MRTTLPLAAAAALALALGPTRATAGGWMLRAGADYAQSDTWRPQGERTRTPRLELDLGLTVGGSLGARGIVDYGGDVQYRRSAVNGDDAVQNHVAYALRSTFLDHPASPMTLTGHAARQDEQFTLQGASAGSVVVNSYGGELVLRGSGGRPSLTGSYGYTRNDSNTLGLGKNDRTIQTVAASTTFGSSAFSYNALYAGAFSDGTFETDRYADHRVTANVDATVAENTRLRLTNGYYVRQTDQLSAINARQEATGASAFLQHTSPSGFAQSGGYSYSRVFQLSTASDIERVAHKASVGLDGPLAPEWTLRNSLNATFDEDRVGTVTARSASQFFSSSIAWRRALPESTVELHGGPTVGVLEPRGGDARLGYGVSAGASHVRNGSVRTSLGYGISFQENVGSDQGWGLTQSASGAASMRLGLASLTGTVMAQADRRSSPVLGTSGSRSLSALGTWRMRRTDLSVQLGYQDGTAGRVASGAGVGDGLILASAYDSHTAFVDLGAGSGLGPLLARARVRFSSSALPDRPSFNETALSGSIDYAYGALRIGIEDSYVVTDVHGGQLRVNQLLVRAYRVFGSRF